MEISTKEALGYKGGAKISLATGILISAICSLVMGIIDGLLNPKTCNRWS